jgi:hypothetical protein
MIKRYANGRDFNGLNNGHVCLSMFLYLIGDHRSSNTWKILIKYKEFQI